MKTTYAVVAALGVASFVCGCDEDKKPTESTATSATATTAAVSASPPPAPKPTPAEAIAKTQKAVIEAWNAHDSAKIAALYEPTGKLVIPGLPDFSGRDAIAGEAKDTFAGYSDFKVALTKTYVKGNTVALQWVITGKNDGPALGQKASGRQMGVAGASVITFDDDGLIKEDHRYLDLPTITSQLDPKAKAGSFRAPLTLPTGAVEEHASKGTPDEAKVLEQVKAFYTAFEAKKEADFMAFVTEDTVGEDYTAPATVKGTKATKDMANGFWKTVPDLAQTKPVQFAAGDTVITEGTLTGTQKGAMGPIKATNKPVSLRFVDIIQMKDGKVARLDTYADSAEMLIEIGAMQPIGPAPATAAAASGAPAGSAAPVAAATGTAKPK
jgi:steroid delta-isomerase-like uncharacterized protein/uncharacterized protein (TIGR02246 family)